MALAVLGGCAPQRVRWMDANPDLVPQRPRQEVRAEQAPGYLVIAMRHLGQPGDQEMERYPPVYVYDRGGQFLAQLPNNTEFPTQLRPGEYIVLVGETDAWGPFHQLQVRIDGGRTTDVSLADIAHAPGLCGLSTL